MIIIVKGPAVLALESGTSGGICGAFFLPLLLLAAVSVVIPGTPAGVALLMEMALLPGRLIIPRLLLPA